MTEKSTLRVPAASPDESTFFVCPICGQSLRAAREALHCRDHGQVLTRRAGIWRCADQDAASVPFLESYRRIRESEGWNNGDPAYLRALPFQDLSGRHPEIWRIRAASFTKLERALARISSQLSRPARLLDLGAGNGWLSLRLSSAGFHMTAVDLSDDPGDGLGATACLPECGEVTFLQSGFDALPMPDHAFDVAIFNGSFHYSADAQVTLGEARRLVKPGGLIAIVDSPVYRREASGYRMLEERRERWLLQHDFEPPDSQAIGFLTRDRLTKWGHALAIRWRVTPLPLGPRWRLKPFLLPLLGRREPARFPVILGRC